MPIDIYIDTSTRTLVSSITGGATVQPSSLPFFYPDSVQINVHLLSQIVNSPIGIPQYQVMSTAGLALVLYINAGTEGSTNLASCLVWQTDPDNTYFTGLLQLGTVGVKQNLGQRTGVQLYLQIGYILNGNTRTLISVPVTIAAGLNTNTLVVPPELTPLSVEAADAMFVPVNGLPAGSGFYLVSPNGKKLYLQAVDNPDGTASFLASPIN